MLFERTKQLLTFVAKSLIYCLFDIILVIFERLKECGGAGSARNSIIFLAEAGTTSNHEYFRIIYSTLENLRIGIRFGAA
jgi:hypothetical protein